MAHLSVILTAFAVDLHGNVVQNYVSAGGCPHSIQLISLYLVSFRLLSFLCAVVHLMNSLHKRYSCLVKCNTRTGNTLPNEQKHILLLYFWLWMENILCFPVGAQPFSWVIESPSTHRTGAKDYNNNKSYGVEEWMEAYAPWLTEGCHGNASCILYWCLPIEKVLG